VTKRHALLTWRNVHTYIIDEATSQRIEDNTRETWCRSAGKNVERSSQQQEPRPVTYRVTGYEHARTHAPTHTSRPTHPRTIARPSSPSPSYHLYRTVINIYECYSCHTNNANRIHAATYRYIPLRCKWVRTWTRSQTARDLEWNVSSYLLKHAVSMSTDVTKLYDSTEKFLWRAIH